MAIQTEQVAHKELVGGVQTLLHTHPPNSFLDLVDTPDNYNNQGGKLVAVKSDSSGLEFVPKEEIPQGGVIAFEDDFESGWFIVNLLFDIQFFDNFDMNWFVSNDFGNFIFVEDFQGDWI